MGAVNTTYTFTPTDTITSTKMNNIIDETVMTADAVLGGSGGSGGLDISSGKLSISANAINSSRIANNAVTTLAIADGNVTPAKLSAGGPSWDGGTFDIKQGAIELGTGITSNTASYIDFHSSFPIIDNDARIIRDSGANGALTISNVGTGAIVMGASGGVTFASANMPNPSGDAPIFGIRAWANINGTVGSVAVRQGGNVSGVVRNQLGRYTITFATPMQDTNYAIVAWARDANATDNNYFVSAASNATKLTGSFQIEVNSPGGTVDSPEIGVMVIR